MGKATDPLNTDPYLDETVSDNTIIEDTGPQPAGLYAEPLSETGMAARSVDTWTTEPDVTAYADDSMGADDDIETHRAQIEQTRTEMSQTIDAIQDKLSPGTIAQQAKDAVRDATVGKAQDMVSNVAGSAQDMVSNAAGTVTDTVSNAGETARDFGSGIWETIRQNPVPAALAGLGIGWLLMSGRKSSGTQTYTGDYRTYSSRQYPYGRTDYGAQGRYSPYEQPYGGEYTGTGSRGYGPTYAGGYATESEFESSPGVTDRIGNAAGQMQDTAGQYASQARDTAGQYVGQAQDLAGQAMSSAQDAAGQMANQVQGAAQGMIDSAQYGMQQAQSGFQQMLRSNPLAVAAGAVAVGIAVGLAIPETEKENELMGPTRDSLMDQAQQTVQEKAQQVQSVAQQAVGAAKDAAQQAADQQGLTS